jgi:hypothetical protein
MSNAAAAAAGDAAAAGWLFGACAMGTAECAASHAARIGTLAIMRRNERGATRIGSSLGEGRASRSGF